MMENLQIRCRARYGLVGNYYISFEKARDAFERGGYIVNDLGNGVLEYIKEIEPDHPMIQEIFDGKHKTYAIERLP